ncbi:GGDEF domain-containing protein [Zemynaea arenosa]|uniref:GGDEF domain-containing protein n=1 Tax=Zemynaea arenosa TaxID=2561931 RepID=UPI001E499726|nr:GGDEF domain-containing protein [Massilia arenosa]
MKTFMLVMAIGNIAFAMMIAGYARGGEENPAMRVWMWAKLVQGLANGLGWLRPDLNSWIVDAAANTALIGGFALETGAYSTFLGAQRWKRVVVPLALICVLLMHSARFGGVGAGGLIAMMSTFMAVFSARMAWLLLAPRADKTLLQRLVGLNNLLFTLVMAMRAYTGAVHSSIGVFTPGVLSTVTFLVGYTLLIVNGFGFLLMCKQQDDRKMRALATTDSLTGLVNRRAFFERTENARMLSARLRKPVALMMLDIDHFKRLNDRFGHATGDEALCLFARTALATLREHDIMGRLGGEEFALVMPGTTLSGALHAAERLRNEVSEAPLLTDGNNYKLTVSIGVVMIDPNEHINAALARADAALYAAKSAGRNRVECGDAISASADVA